MKNISFGIESLSEKDSVVLESLIIIERGEGRMRRTLKHAHTLADKYDNEQLDVMHVGKKREKKNTSARA